MLTVREIMNRDVFTVGEDDRLSSVAWRLNAELVSGAPVRDRHGNVTGILSKTDIVGADQPLQMMRAADVMHRDIWCIDPDESVVVAAELMTSKGAHRLLVADGPGAPLGIVTAMDVVRAVAEGRLAG